MTDDFVPKTTMPIAIAKDYLNYAICHALSALPTFVIIIHNQ